MASCSILSQTLQEITNIKLEELTEKRESYEEQKEATTANCRSQTDPLSALKVLSDGAKSCFDIRSDGGRVVRGSTGNPRLEVDLRNLDRFLDQARFDPSISDAVTTKLSQTILRHFEVQSSSYCYADLYGQLTKEWLSATQSKTNTADGNGAMELSQDFEKLETRARLESRQSWEQEVFLPTNVDLKEINNFLDTLFHKKEAKQALQRFKEELGVFEAGLAFCNQFNEASLQWVIRGLLSSDLMTDEQRRVLREFQQNKVILSEISDVLNMRTASLGTWSWGKEVLLEQRRELDGHYRIYMHEDLLQAMFLHYIGAKWSVFLKPALRKVMLSSGALLNEENKVTKAERQRRDWFYGKIKAKGNVQQRRAASYQAGFLGSQLMDGVNDDRVMEEGDVEADFEGAVKKQRVFGQQSMQQPQQYMGARNPRAKQTARKAVGHSLFAAPEAAGEESDEAEETGSDLDSDSEDDLYIDLTPFMPKNSMDAKQKLLHLLSTDILIRNHLQRETTCFRTSFEAWNTLLPHGTIMTILQYFGVQGKWLKFFESFMQAPLRFMDEEGNAQLRRKGVPGSHAISDILSELVLFCLDVAVNEPSQGDYLWRLNEQLWFWGPHESCIAAWKTVSNFTKIMGVRLDDPKSGSVRLHTNQAPSEPVDVGTLLPKGEIRWGMLYLDRKTGRFTIDKDMVMEHVEELRKQLKGKEKSIFSWVQAYSTYASVFFTSNFGKPANVYGRGHVDEMLKCHETIQRSLFSDEGDPHITSVVDWLKAEIARRFDVTEIPDGYLYFPFELGGLEVKNPFIGLLQLREATAEDPAALLLRFEEAEKDAYSAAKKKFHQRKPYEWRQQTNTAVAPEKRDQFPTFEEYVQYRETLNYGFPNQLVDVYDELMRSPSEQSIDMDEQGTIASALARIHPQGNHWAPTAIQSNWWMMTPYWKWVTSLYGVEMINKFGGLRIVDPALLPMGMVNEFRAGRVAWSE